MRRTFKRGTAIIAVALVLTYVSTIALTEMQEFARWSANLAWLGLSAVLCGALLVLIDDGAAWSMVAASVLAAGLFTGLWGAIFWTFLGEYVTPWEIVISNPFILQVLPQSGAILLTTVLLGLMGVAVATISLPDRCRP